MAAFASTRLNASRISACTVAFSAFSRSGRFSASVATAPSMDNLTVLNSIARSSGLGARARRNFAVPTADVLRVRRPLDLRRAHEIDGCERRNVGNRKAIAGHERPRAELAFEDREKGKRLRLVRLAPFGNLRLLACAHGGTEVAE